MRSSAANVVFKQLRHRQKTLDLTEGGQGQGDRECTIQTAALCTVDMEDSGGYEKLLFTRHAPSRPG